MDLLTSHWPIAPALQRLVILLFPIGLACGVSAQCTLSCTQGLQISLDPNGNALVTTQLVAPNATNSCPGTLELSLFNNLGQPLSNPLSCENIGQSITARVRHTATGNFCTSDISVYDALSPTVFCPDMLIFCNQDSDPSAVGIPSAADNCTPSNALNFNHFDQETNLGCGVFQNGIPVLKRIDRQWTITDEHGNTSACTQKIWLKHIQASDIIYPKSRDNIAAPALACGDDPDNLDLTGEPMVAGIPVGASIDCEIAVTHSDQTINYCPPASYTVLRTWTTIDFCTGNISSRLQTIKVEDKVAPVITPPENITIGTDGFSCAGSLTLPQATATDNCSAISILPNWSFGSGYGPFNGIPIGTHTVTYVATDACGNSSSATMTVTVEDSTPPQAICSASLQLSLSASGAAFLNAGTIGSNSSDNCGTIFLSVSRDGENYFPQLLFTCADIGAPIVATLRVRDEVGLENFCESEISVRDFLKPTIQCPPAITISCLQDYTNLQTTGQATAADNCSTPTVVFQDNATVNACNIGSVTRIWRAIDAADNQKSCSQQITLSPVNTTTVAFPADVAISNCSNSDDILPAATGTPVLGGQACSALSVNYIDHYFSGNGVYCARILRDWKVVDQCIYNPNGGTSGIWEHTQIIDIVDNTPPQLEPPADITIATDPHTCTAIVTIDDVFTNDCSNQVVVGNNSLYASNPGSNASGIYPIGTHTITFTATDGCGNSTVKSFLITVSDQTPPTAICRTGVSINIHGAPATATLLPADIDAGSSDDCSNAGSLTISVAPNIFSCQQIGNQTVTLTVADIFGNISECATVIQVLDNNHLCNGGGLGVIVDGGIRTPTGMAVRNIPVMLQGIQSTETLACDTLGVFAFQDVPMGDTCILRPSNNANWLNGVTTFDLVLMSKHILGITPLDSPLKMIAADANRSNSITTFDIVQLRKVLLGILDTIPGNTSWRFIDSSFVFPNMLNPFSTPFPEEIQLKNITTNQTAQNFTAIKIGDVNNSTDPANARAPKDTIFLSMPDLLLKTDTTAVIPVEMPNWQRLEGFQFELAFDPEKIEVKNIAFPNSAILNEQHVSLKNGHNLAVSWNNSPNLHNAPLGSEILYLTVRAKSNTALNKAVSIRQNHLAPEAYFIENEEIAAISLHSAGSESSVENELLSIAPNPNAGNFTVQNPFYNATCTLRIVNTLGETIWQQEGNFQHSITVTAMQLPPGLYVVELSSEGRSATGRMVKF